MRKIKPYIIAVIIVMLGVAPLLSLPTTARASQDKYCNCCQGPCHGCCCSKEKKQEPSKNSREDKDQCSCKISTLPIVPEQKVESTIKNDNHSETNEVNTEINEIVELTSSNHISDNHSPPIFDITPKYIKNSAFLI